jgi:acyl-CoA dehydrogenase
LRHRQLVFPDVEAATESDGLRKEVRHFLAQELASNGFIARCDAWLGGHSPDFSRRLGVRGWVGMTIPRRYGGRESGALERFVVAEELLAAGAPVAAHWITDRQVAPMLLKFGTERQKLEFLPAIARGELYFAIGMSEPNSGSDLASIQSSAVRTEGGWLLNGSKVWISHAHRSRFMVTLCRTASRGNDRHAGLSQMIVDLNAPGMIVKPLRIISGEDHFCEIFMNRVFVPDEMLIGELHAGWSQVTSELAFERSGPERFLSTFPLMTELVRAATASGDWSPAAAEVVGRLVAHLHCLRRLSLGVAATIDRGGVPGTEAALVKEMGTRYEREVTDAARRLFEVDSMSTELRARFAEALLHGPGFTLRGGTNEILRGVVARDLVRQ